MKTIVSTEEVEKMGEAMIILNKMLRLYHNVANELNKDNLAFDGWFTRLIKENAENQKTVLEYWKLCQKLNGEKAKH